MITTKLSMEVRDKDDYRLIEKREQPGRSFLIGMMAHLYSSMTQLNANNVKDINGAVQIIEYPSQNMPGIYGICTPNFTVCARPGGCTELGFSHRLGFSASISSYSSGLVGIVIGTGNTAATPIDFQVTQIVHGQGVGQVIYGGCGIDTLTSANPNASFVLRRHFTNIAGGNITINEVGIYAAAQVHDNADTTSLGSTCIYRDIIGGGLSIVNGNLVLVTITIQITV